MQDAGCRMPDAWSPNIPLVSHSCPTLVELASLSPRHTHTQNTPFGRGRKAEDSREERTRHDVISMMPALGLSTAGVTLDFPSAFSLCGGKEYVLVDCCGCRGNGCEPLQLDAPVPYVASSTLSHPHQGALINRLVQSQWL